MKKNFYFSLLTLFFFNISYADQKGIDIATETVKRNTGWVGSEVVFQMILKNASGGVAERIIRSMALENDRPNEGDKSLSIFDTPADVEGTIFLSHTKIKKPDDQWLFLPALKRVKRISSSNKSGPFMGSEYAYEDLLSFEIDRFTHTFLREEKCPGSFKDVDCFVVEQKPTYENSGYTRRIVWTHKNDYKAVYIDYYDRKNSLLKSLTFDNYKLYKDKFWRAHELNMVNHQTKKSTLIVYEPYNFDATIDKSLFNPNKLKRIR